MSDFEYEDFVEPSVDEIPEGDAEFEAWLEEEQQPQQGVDYPALEGLTPEAAAFMDEAQWGTRQQVALEASAEALLGRVQELAGDDVHGPQALGQVAAYAYAARFEVFTRHLANGLDVVQAGAQADLVVDGAIREGLREQAYLKMTAGTSLSQWREGRAQMDADRARDGKTPLASPYDSPTWQRMNRASRAYVEREQQRREEMANVTARIVGKQWWR